MEASCPSDCLFRDVLLETRHPIWNNFLDQSWHIPVSVGRFIISLPAFSMFPCACEKRLSKISLGPKFNGHWQNKFYIDSSEDERQMPQRMARHNDLSRSSATTPRKHKAKRTETARFADDGEHWNLFNGRETPRPQSSAWTKLLLVNLKIEVGLFVGKFGRQWWEFGISAFCWNKCGCKISKNKYWKAAGGACTKTKVMEVKN